MTGSKQKPGYYAVIPADVRYDVDLPPNAKLLYGEISALLSDEGYCYASNQYFADLFQVTTRTVSDLVAKLQERGHITVIIRRNEKGKVVRREIRCTVSLRHAQPVEENFDTPRKNLLGGIEENFQYTNTSNTNLNGDIEPPAAVCAVETTHAGNPQKPAAKGKGNSEPKDQLDDDALKAALETQVESLSKQFPMDRNQKNRLYQIALHWYTPRTLASKHAAPPVHTALGISNLFRKLARGAAVIGIDAATEVFYDALSRGHTDIHDERFKVGYKALEGRARSAAPAPDDGNGVYKRL